MKTSMKISLAAGALAGTMAMGVFIGEAAAEQRHMQDALTHLQEARDDLSVAMHNKGGHRVRALELTNEAIEQVQLGIDRAED